MKKTIHFDLSEGEAVCDGNTPHTISNKAALLQWVEKIIRTEAGRYRVYDGTEYGSEVSAIARGGTYGFDFARSEIERDIRYRMMLNEEIRGVDRVAVSQAADGTLSVTVRIRTVYGDDTEVIEI